MNATTRDACANCGAPFVPAQRAFCPECGQETRIEPPTLREFAQQFGGAYVSTEGALWRTLKLLLTRPGELTALYLAGRRKHYVLPLRLYLSVSVVVFLLARLWGGVEVVSGLDRVDQRVAEQGDLPTLVLKVGAPQLGIREGAFVCESIPAPLCRLIRSRAAPDTRTFLARIHRANQRVSDNIGALMFVLLPAFAACLRIVNWRSGMRYAAHLVFALHLHTLWFLVLLAMQLVRGPVVWLGAAVMVVYTLLAGRRVYGGAWGPRLLRSVALTLMYGTMFAVTVPAAWLLALLA